MESSRIMKNTPAGLFPEDWVVVQLGTKASVFRGGSPRPIDSFLTNDPDGINWIKIGDVAVGAKYIKQTEEKIIPEGAARSRKVNAGDFLLSNSMSFGRPYILQIDGCIHDGWLVIQEYYDTFETDYLYYALNAGYVLEQYKSMAAGSSVLNLNKDIVKRVHVAVPSRSEQIIIADALSGVDNMIGALDEAIAKKRQIKEGLMQQLLTGKIRLPGFNEEWRSCKLKELAEMYSGGTPSSKEPRFYGGDIPFLSISDMTSSGKYIYSTEKTITKLGLENSSARVFPAGTLMYAMYASLGKCSISRIETAISQAILGFILSDKIDKMYLYYHFCFIEEQVKNMGQTGTQSNLSKALVEQFTIPVPELAEQGAIADVLSTIDDDIFEIELKRDKYLSIKQGMMQELLTGETRL